MKIIAILASCFVFTCNVHAAPPEVVLIGHYSNLKISQSYDPHYLSGYGLDLYRKGSVVFGNIHIGIGSPEPAHATLYDVTFDASEKSISFKAKYSSGWQYSKETSAAGRESRVLLTFSGRLTPNSVRGKFNIKDGYKLSAPGTNISVVMKKENNDYVEESFESWKASQDWLIVDW